MHVSLFNPIVSLLANKFCVIMHTQLNAMDVPVPENSGLLNNFYCVSLLTSSIIQMPQIYIS